MSVAGSVHRYRSNWVEGGRLRLGLASGWLTTAGYYCVMNVIYPATGCIRVLALQCDMKAVTWLEGKVMTRY